MAALTYDGQSFMIDGRRIWLVAGSVEYTRVPRAAWKDRLAAAKAAGLNTITTSVVWSRHESRPGQFNFTDDNDLRAFVTLARDAGMYVVLRMGPYLGSGWDLGGLPPWLLGVNNINLRTANQPFLEACSRFIGAVAKQVGDLQASTGETPDEDEDDEPNTGGGANAAPAPIKPGPIVLIQSESGWTCGNDTLAAGYLGELHRYLRESGFEVPIVNANNLWQGVEGEIDGWTGSGPLLANLRQLAMVRPSQPRYVAEYRLAERAVWGEAQPQGPEPDAIQRGLLEMIAAAAQFNIDPFCAGTNFGFLGGRLGSGPAAFTITSDDRGAPLGESGQARESYHAVRRICMFASRFGRLLSHLDGKRHAVSLVPPTSRAYAPGTDRHAARRGGASHVGGYDGPVVVHATGTQGQVVFIFAPPPGQADHRNDAVDLLLPDGTTLPVYLGTQPVGWVLLDTRIVGRSQLDYCNLSAIAVAGRVLVVSGPAGTSARLSINGADLHAEVPSEGDPLLIDHEGVIVCIAADSMLGDLHIADDAVYMGVDGLTLDGQPIVGAWGTKFRKVSGEARWETVVAELAPKVIVKAAPPPPPPPAKGAKARKGRPLPPPPPPAPVAPPKPTAVLVPHHKATGRVTLSAWTAAPIDEYTDGTGPRYAAIGGPAELAQMGASFGYGWYRLVLKSSSARTLEVMAPGSGDRLAIFAQGKPTALLGLGPGAEPSATIRLARGEQTLVVLAENLGRFSEGGQVGEPKGLCGHLWSVSPLRAQRGELVDGAPVDVLAFRSPLWQLHPGDVTESRRVRWSVPGRHKAGVVITLDPRGYRGLLLLNDKPVRYFDPSGPATIFLQPDALAKGKNTLELALIGAPAAAAKDLVDAVGFLDVDENLTAKAEWSFAKWEPPAASAYRATHARQHTPRWWKSIFRVASSGDLTLDVSGLSKGQAYVNGRHMGRYFTLTGEGKRVGPQTTLHVPGSWLHAGGDNEVVLFDEHGFVPAKVRLFGSGGR